MKKLLVCLAALLMLLSCTAAASADAQPLSAEAELWWNGAWYGWRIVSAAGGSFAERQGERSDVVGSMETSDEHGVLVLWDYDSFAECCFLTANGDFFKDESGLGRFYSLGGFAFDGALEEKTLSARPVWELDHMLLVKGVYTDPEDAHNWFRYEIYLRPWGMRWEDAQSVGGEELPFSDMRPAQYEDWYLMELSRGFDPLSEPELDTADK